MVVNKKNTNKQVENSRKRILLKEINENLGLPTYLTTTQRGDDFVLSKTEEKGYNMFLFSTESNMEHLENADIWVADGTFRSCPEGYSQLYIIFAPVMGKFVPLVYALLEGKTIKHYNNLFYS
ncbi:hypothetical protein DMUE_2611 [Dictyocoela muelleri]|nr:hypothetical protein DMUE_2611 [Dictyocoela muelleri]